VFRLLYHPAVASDDLPAIPRDVQARTARAIERRLTTDPDRMGAPLRGTLKGYWKLRIGDYRVVYAIRRNGVLIFAIRHRRTVYADVRSRLP